MTIPGRGRTLSANVDQLPSSTTLMSLLWPLVSVSLAPATSSCISRLRLTSAREELVRPSILWEYDDDSDRAEYIPALKAGCSCVLFASF